MKEHPILLGPEWVRAILGGRKTQTRRPVDLSHVDHRVDWIGWDGGNGLMSGWYGYMGLHDDEGLTGLRGPTLLSHRFGVPGDRLWVRETWAPVPKERPTKSIVDPSFATRRIWYRADEDKPCWGGRWKPSIFLERKDSRIDLEIVDIRAERVQSMTSRDAVAEGVANVEEYSFRWNRIYKLYPWEGDPWVWVVSFRVLEIKSGKDPATNGDRYQ